MVVQDDESHPKVLILNVFFYNKLTQIERSQQEEIYDFEDIQSDGCIWDTNQIISELTIEKLK